MARWRLVSLAALAAFCLSPLAASAGDRPTAATSTVPSAIKVVGSAAGTPDVEAGRFTIVARQILGFPCNGASVVLDFSSCPEIVLCTDQLDPDVLVNCAAKTVRKFTNSQGEATFTILGGSVGDAASLAHSVKVYGNGILLGSPSVAAYDLDGSGGIGAGDLSAWLTDFGSGEPWSRSDYDGDGFVGAGDLSDWLTVFGHGNSVQSCASACP